MKASEARQLLRSSWEKGFVDAVRQVLKEYRRSRWLTINQAAELADVSVRCYQRRLADENRSFSELIDEVRAALVTELLRDTAISLREIAAELGYSTQANFTRAVQRWTGKTPAEFRND